MPCNSIEEYKSREVSMQNLAEKTTRQEVNYEKLKFGNGLKKLVIYYQDLFDIKENLNHYSPSDYQNAKRRFVKYLLKNRHL